MTTKKTSLPAALHAAHAWTAAAGELDELRALSGDALEQYAAESAANAIEHSEEDVGADEILDLAEWLRADAPGYWADDGNGATHYPDAASGEEAARQYVADGDWGARRSTWWCSVATWRHLDRDGERVGQDSHRIAIEPEEPPCTHIHGHDWVDALPPRGSGGGVTFGESCSHCDVLRLTDTWATDTATGEQGLTSVRYGAADADDADEDC